jgi:hypothetical protein
VIGMGAVESVTAAASHTSGMRAWETSAESNSL